jgi:hypothetical protein
MLKLKDFQRWRRTMTDLTGEPIHYTETLEKRVAAKAGISLDVVQRILYAKLDLLLALGLPHSDEEDEKRGAALKEKYPDLLRPAVVNSAGRSAQTPVSYELEATIVQLESGETVRDVVEVLATESELLGLGYDVPMYRAWAKNWVK